MTPRARAALAVAVGLSPGERAAVAAELAELAARERLLQVAGVDVEHVPSCGELLERARAWWQDVERLARAEPEAAAGLVRAQAAHVVAAGVQPRRLDDDVAELRAGGAG